MNTLETILKSIQNVKVIDHSIAHKNYIPLDLSTFNVELSKLDIGNAIDFEKYIENYLTANKAQVAFGGYNEERNLYKRSAVFNDTKTEERNIHIGLDLWIKAVTPVLAALDGIIHSFNYNAGLGDYGPTLILEHKIENHIFYTLYGHLSLESITGIEIGDVVKKGQQLATLGDASVNGDYAPHLHFQIIKTIGENFGDYPGVCSKSDLGYYLENCPDPNLLLKIT
ncbi:peptidoglycan DD-metalloendopeptidase family protein [Flavobacterium gawalongense]|uniref:Peptidoglycan DD-metalloendopeptidase family protein n=1 Tax=Flavobacterium gawalongense TaxID=2594432 RepID=A0A553BPE2_9FLAO|nr:peptidoglycan DD-metalloendopeptidase family protein [Flavobacterium gawalongense]TRX10129.1 peptidoglycan DD-metalloendopeptidase family protein [Flavobacterium gawalongense]TRX11142.1 peptidoglycan DD-metalloendopeptidase family protein [Flavobacterium gawalongense]TRX28791.1 peptidoglycan DD-metalloendopeptidase family protein [Flavobacterium gawalongense]